MLLDHCKWRQLGGHWAAQLSSPVASVSWGQWGPIPGQGWVITDQSELSIVFTPPPVWLSVLASPAQPAQQQLVLPGVCLQSLVNISGHDYVYSVYFCPICPITSRNLWTSKCSGLWVRTFYFQLNSCPCRCRPSFCKLWLVHRPHVLSSARLRRNAPLMLTLCRDWDNKEYYADTPVSHMSGRGIS